ncbi:DNA polymerase zeta catalytic subunit-like, partial [Babylonia areolata]
VYLPCALQTKKRYVGFMYETRDQREPVFDAKGIETVRRDNCGVVSKVLERCIKILFTQRDVSQVRAYLHRQLTKMLVGRVGLQDFVFAKEYRGMMGYKPGACVPALEIARKRLRMDRRAEPRVGERVPYVIVHGSPGLPLIQLVRQPRELLLDPSLRVNVTYYINKQVLPALDRLLSLVGVSVFQWYSDMPKVVRLTAPLVAPTSKQGTISQYFVTSDCLVCERQTKEAVCPSCRQDPQMVALTLATRCANFETVQHRLAQVCQTCMGVQDSTQPCVSLDCPVLFRRHLATLDLARADLHREALLKLTTF